MGFEGIYTAVYDYQPQTENELQISEGDLLYVLDKNSDDGWWKAKRKTTEIDAEEPVGLVPTNYVEEAKPLHQAKSLYDYTRQTDEEVSFSEDAEILVYDTSDPDWTLVRVNDEYGFAPANYIEVTDTLDGSAAPGPEEAGEEEAPPPLQQRSPLPQPEPVSAPEPEPEPEPEPQAETELAHSPARPAPAQGPASAIAGILHQSRAPAPDASRPVPSPTPAPPPPATIYTPEESDEVDEAPPPALPRRPPSQLPSPPQEPVSPPPEPSPRDRPDRLKVPRHASFKDDSAGIQPSPPFSRVGSNDTQHRYSVSPSGYHLYNISEMVSVMGKKKKMPTTLGINVATGTIFISPEKSEDGPHQEWTADRLTHYSIEGKHVFVDLVRPSKSVDFHAGAKDTAQEIVSALGEIAGGYKAEGLREVIAAGTGGAKKKGQILYDFVAQGDDEVTVSVGDEVIIVDDLKSDEWWMVRRIRNGKEGVVPSSYVEITGVVSKGEASYTGANAGLSTVDQNRLAEQQMAKESARKPRQDSVDARVGEVGPGMKLPERSSSLLANHDGNNRSQRHKRDSKSSKPSEFLPPRSAEAASLDKRKKTDGNLTKLEPNPSKTRKWTDRTGTFTVVAEFIGLTDGKIHLHKQNGVKIAVPVAKMSIEDLEFVEKMTGVSLDEDKPLSDIKRRSQVGATVKKQEYDWFDLFLKAGVGPHQCERYAQNFTRDSMDESILPDITSENLRTLGLKEGDILRVMKYLDNQYRNGKSKRSVTFGGEELIDDEQKGGLFSGPGGALRNNTRKGRPAPAVQTSDVVDPRAFESKDGSGKPPSPIATSPSSKEPEAPKGFEDDAWAVKTPKQPATSAAAPTTTTPVSSAPTSASTIAPVTQPAAAPPLTGAMADLSLLQAPLQPTNAAQAPQPVLSQPTLSLAPPQPPQASQPQATGASPAFFSQIPPPQQPQIVMPQLTGYVAPQQQQQQHQQSAMLPRQRPQPPPMNQGSSSLLPPPPQRPLSAPQNPVQQSAFGPPLLQPQLTGLQPPLAGYIPQSQFGNQLLAQPTGIMAQQQPLSFQSLAPQQTGYPAFSPAMQQQQPSSINSVLPPPLQPQRTGINGFAGNTSFTPSPPPIPPIPQQPIAQPLMPQKTGPPPAVRFGVKSSEPKKLAPQPTGMRANLAQASMCIQIPLAHYPPLPSSSRTNQGYFFKAPSNPFGF